MIRDLFCSGKDYEEIGRQGEKEADKQRRQSVKKQAKRSKKNGE